MLVTFVLVLIVAAGLFKLALIFVWTHRLHNAHSDKHSFSAIFRMMFAPQSEDKVGKDFWADLQPIQRWNFLSNVLIGLLVGLSIPVMAKLFHILS
jgi:hypothetical protein